MPRFTVSQTVRAPATVTWATLVDWPRHGDWAPFTSVAVTGDRAFTARTGIGRLAFDDPMTVTGWQPPSGDTPGDSAGRCEVTKHGHVIRGYAWFTVTPLPGNRSRVLWGEDVTVWPHRLTRLTAPAFEAIGWLGFKTVLRSMAEAAAR
ncbi:SRPBCC family protein [Actinoplanes couchii]|uniref:Polyketide cyclase/dehydrase n=1 Tax=Actinoplanes couchii TaxID=403638 RepID=A0ABQ3X864_9ACTN|nr:SRPBCC family protein [Actinoplanes couchii]MDR6320290.1 hypothetical protein [Actinoplanes couchii]GID54695.1 hypothetical protein Aco03nite_030990 [Actinoplanes couchii]